MFVYRFYAFSRARLLLTVGMAGVLFMLTALAVYEYARYSAMTELRQQSSVLQVEYGHVSKYLAATLDAAVGVDACAIERMDNITVLSLGKYGPVDCGLLPIPLRGQLRPPYWPAMTFRGLTMQPSAAAWFVNAAPSPSAVAVPLNQLLEPLQRGAQGVVFNLVEAASGRTLTVKQEHLVAGLSPSVITGSGPIPLQFYDGSWRYFSSVIVDALPGLVLVGSVSVGDVIARITPLLLLSIVVAILISRWLVQRLFKPAVWRA